MERKRTRSNGVNGQNTGKTGIDRMVFFGSALLVLPFVLLGLFFPHLLDTGGKAALNWITDIWGWLYLLSVNVFVVAGLAIALSPLGSIRLGRDDEKPEYSWLSWFAMLFSAGMGIGLVFWSVAEPLYHFSSPPMGEANSAQSAQLAIRIFFHHWGIHAWATYVAVGLPIAYFQFRKGTGCRISSCLLPLFSRKVSKDHQVGATGAALWVGRIVDILAVWATVLGVVTSLGLGAMQIVSGLSITFGVSKGLMTTAVVIVVITLLFIISAVSGVKRGIKTLSLLNVAVMLVLFVFFLVCGPFSYLVKTFFAGLSGYLANIIPLSTTFTLFNNLSWTRSWTIFYWAWWIAWAPFVGAFIASISRGRTIREFVLMVMLVPALFSFLFASALGGTAIHLQLFDHIPLVKAMGEGIEGTLFTTLRQLPWYGISAVITNILIASFFITSADSATFVISRFSALGGGGDESSGNNRLIVFWGVVLGGLALVLIFSGGTKGLQTASIVGALPFIFVMYALLVSCVRELVVEKRSITIGKNKQ